jgi:hypothetical protein
MKRKGQQIQQEKKAMTNKSSRGAQSVIPDDALGELSGQAIELYLC